MSKHNHLSSSGGLSGIPWLLDKVWRESIVELENVEAQPKSFIREDLPNEESKLGDEGGSQCRFAVACFTTQVSLMIPLLTCAKMHPLPIINVFSIAIQNVRTFHQIPNNIFAVTQ